MNKIKITYYKEVSNEYYTQENIFCNPLTLEELAEYLNFICKLDRVSEKEDIVSISIGRSKRK